MLGSITLASFNVQRRHRCRGTKWMVKQAAARYGLLLIMRIRRLPSGTLGLADLRSDLGPTRWY
jgi:hypothetical protein